MKIYGSELCGQIATHIGSNIGEELTMENWQTFTRLPNLNLINIFSASFHSRFQSCL